MKIKNWYLNQLYKETNQPTLTFAFNGTINWMRALSIVCREEINIISIKSFYQKVDKRKQNIKLDIKVFENIMMAIHNLHSLQVINKNIKSPYSIVRTQIITWYYVIYYVSSAMMLAKSGSQSETHSGTAKLWHNDLVKNNLIMIPFNLYLDTLVEKDIKEIISEIRENNKFDLNNYPNNKDESYGCLYSYLSGTAEYKKQQKEEEIKKSKDFKKLNVNDFRTKKVRELRDKQLKKGFVNFLTQAFRYRGKANYRDSVFLSYNRKDIGKLQQFIKDLERVVNSFFGMGVYYCYKRVDNNYWKNFIEDLRNNLLFEFDFNLLEYKE